jgi:long-subunit acyl-CoA synthetase (AMP-forming)
MSPSNIEGAIRRMSDRGQRGGDRRRPQVHHRADHPGPDAAIAYAAANDLPDASYAVIAAHAGLRAHLDAGIEQANATLSRVEQIKKFVILPDIWEPGRDLVTPTLKLERKPIAERYAAEIEALYA